MAGSAVRASARVEAAVADTRGKAQAGEEESESAIGSDRRSEKDE